MSRPPQRSRGPSGPVVRRGKGPDASHAFATMHTPVTAPPDQAGPGRVAYSVEEVARVVGIGRTLAWAMVRSGELPSVRVAGRVLVRRRQLLEWLDAMPEATYPSAS
jgi:excisionase family DNA binding protein